MKIPAGGGMKWMGQQISDTLFDGAAISAPLACDYRD
jgi:hypothetical protein